MRGLLMLAACAAAALAVAGCNTLVGVGKDAATVGGVVTSAATAVIP